MFTDRDWKQFQNVMVLYGALSIYYWIYTKCDDHDDEKVIKNTRKNQVCKQQDDCFRSEEQEDTDEQKQRKDAYSQCSNQSSISNFSS